MAVERIIRATFANPDRRKFAQSEAFYRDHSLYPDNINPEALIQRITTEMPKALQRFAEEKIQLYEEVNDTQLLEDLKKHKWYGPYKYDNYYLFQTATDSGNFEGLLLQISFEDKGINLYFYDKKSYQYGTCFAFNNN